MYRRDVPPMPAPESSSPALLLSGGGARAAYQVGVLKGLRDILPSGIANPFPIICGTSAGGLNAAGIACQADRFSVGIELLENIWANFHTHQVYRTDVLGVWACALRFLATLMIGRLGQNQAVSLLDNRPLRQLLSRHLDMERLPVMIEAGHLHALAITASGYTSGESVSFFQGHPELQPWARSRRIGVRTDLSVDHLMASAAIPVIFPAVRVHREFFGDGAVRQLAPISPALHLGADRVLVIGVSSKNQVRRQREQVNSYPSIAQIIAHIMANAFIDSLEGDIERLNRVNHTISLIPPEVRADAGVALRPVQVLTIAPPNNVIENMALRHVDSLPYSVRMFVQGSGATRKSGAGVLSYLLFEAEYSRALIELGYTDAINRREEILAFMGQDPMPGAASDGTASASP